MSMICYLLRFTTKQLDVLKSSPGSVGDLFRVAIDDERNARMAEIMKRLPEDKRAAAEAHQKDDPFWRDQAVETRAAKERLKPFGEVAAALCLQKSWHMLHYLFTGSTGPVGSPGDVLLTGGEEIGDDIGGYGPPRWLSPNATGQVAQFLKGFNAEALASRVNLKEMSAAGVYGIPSGRGAENEEPALRDEVAHFFPLLRAYVEMAVEKSDGLLIWIA
jgi:hypothetical protein